MCFTIEVHLSRRAIEKRFAVDTSALYDFDFHYFYKAFSNPMIPVIPQQDPGKAQLMQWGLIPSWVRDRAQGEKIRSGTYNARSESLHEKPSFREPLRNGRCLVIAHGYYEWQQIDGKKIPWYIRLKSDRPFVFAGLYDRWKDPEEGGSHLTFSIITTAANPLLEKIHNTKLRMPVILPEELEKEWVNDKITLHQAKELLVAIDEGLLQAHTVTPALSGAESHPDDPGLVIPYDHPVSGNLF